MNAIPLLLCLAAADPLAEARGHLAHGRYEEATEAFAGAGRAGADPTAVALGATRVLIETGRYDEAAAALGPALEGRETDADLLARRGELRLLRGDWDGAAADAAAALKTNPDHPAARWVAAESLAETGKIAGAADGYRWFVRFYNRNQPADAETLATVARGAVKYARWKRVSSIYHFLVRDLCPDIAKADPDDWRADAISGELLLEKYNEAQGVPDLERALAKNPSAAEAHAALAAVAVEGREFDKAAERIEAALAANPACVAALGLKADVALAAGDDEAVRPPLDAALAVNPNDQETLARLAAIEVLAGRVDGAAFSRAVDAVEAGDPTRLDESTALGRIVSGLLRRNPKPGAFLNRLGASLEGRRRYAEAERAYRAAVALTPELPEPQVALGLLAMRGGDLGRARSILDAAFKADPFHVRVSNMRKVVGLLETYETVETPHFAIRFDGAQGRVLAELAAEFLEGAYPEVTGEFGFEPPGRTVVEIFQTGQGQTGHEWFSARMVGLPWLQTIGASTGQMVALASPTAGRGYNWARVLRHEFVHVATLQQTAFRMPHWYAEAIAVRSEGSPRPEEWDRLLRERVPKGELRRLDDLNEAFVSPDRPEDWQFAYCQAALYAEHLDTFGGEVHRKLLRGFASGLTTADAIAQATGLTADEFEAGYRERLRKIAEGLGPGVETAELPDEVRELLEDAVTAVRRKKPAEAAAMLEAALDREAPQPRVLELLGKVRMKEENAAAAAELFALGRRKFPHERKWLTLQAAASMTLADSPELRRLLAEAAEAEPDDAAAAKRLAELSAAAGEPADAKRWAMRALQVTPNDAALHGLLGDACESLGETDRAATARRHAAAAEESDAAEESGAAGESDAAGVDGDGE